MERTTCVHRRSLRSTSGLALVEGFVSARSTEPDITVEIAGGPGRATVHVRVAEGRPQPLALDGSGCGRLHVRAHIGGVPITVLLDDRVILRGTLPQNLPGGSG